MQLTWFNCLIVQIAPRHAAKFDEITYFCYYTVAQLYCEALLGQFYTMVISYQAVNINRLFGPQPAKDS